MEKKLYEEILSNVISYPTVNPPGNEKELAEYLDGVLKDLGFKSYVQDVSPGRANVIAEFGPEDAEESIMLSGHLDVVGVEDNWSTDPFELTIKDNRYYGRGTCDMKGQVVAMIIAAKRLMDEKVPLKRKVMLGFVADEEIGTTGTQVMVNSGVKPTYCVIGEPTEMDIDIAHRGVNHYGVTFTGRAGHASSPQSALNPIYPAAMFVLEIEKLQEELQKKEHYILPSPTVTADIIRGGVQWNAVPESCMVEVDRRTIPEEDKEYVYNEYLNIIEKVKAQYPEIKYEHTYISGIPSSEPQEDFILKDICKEVLEEMGVETRIRDFPAGTDQYVHLQAGIDCVLVGPGSISKQAHITDEYLDIPDAELGIEFYYNLIAKMAK
ncbi:MAG: M20 family metallopeptidase [Tissierellia bacterium]|nr:M20 family metallopeptidase [Tissierellia bacterium]